MSAASSELRLWVPFHLAAHVLEEIPDCPPSSWPLTACAQELCTQGPQALSGSPSTRFCNRSRGSNPVLRSKGSPPPLTYDEYEFPLYIPEVLPISRCGGVRDLKMQKTCVVSRGMRDIFPSSGTCKLRVLRALSRQPFPLLTTVFLFVVGKELPYPSMVLNPPSPEI